MCNPYSCAPVPWRKRGREKKKKSPFPQQRAQWEHLSGNRSFNGKLFPVGYAVTAWCTRWLLWDTMVKSRTSPVWGIYVHQPAGQTHAKWNRRSGWSTLLVALGELIGRLLKNGVQRWVLFARNYISFIWVKCERLACEHAGQGDWVHCGVVFC